MTWKKLLVFVLAIFILGGTAMFGAMAGGIVVYQLMSKNQPIAVAITTQTSTQAPPQSTSVANQTPTNQTQTNQTGKSHNHC